MSRASFYWLTADLNILVQGFSVFLKLHLGDVIRHPKMQKRSKITNFGQKLCIFLVIIFQLNSVASTRPRFYKKYL